MRFAKLQGLGNDFILLDARESGSAAPPLTREQAVSICDRHLGVGADGVLTLLAGPGGESRLHIQNADGSVPEMCGNGARCAALWILTRGCTQAASGTITLLTDAGRRPCVVEAPSAGLGEVEIEMGVPRLEAQRALPVDGGEEQATPVSMGNPHLVIFPGGPTPSRERLTALASTAGRALCAAGNGNIEFVARLGPQRYAASVWERGAGLTQACGTGACAVAAAAIARGLADAGAPIAVELPGGTLQVRLDAATGQLRMRGPAQFVYRGEW